MPAAYTHYWSGSTLKPESEGLPFSHTAGNLFVRSGVTVGDRVFGITVRKGTPLLIGGMTLSRPPITYEEAQKLLPYEPWEANEHLIAERSTASSMSCNRVIPWDVVRRLRFDTSNGEIALKFLTNTQLDHQTLRGVRKLTQASAAELERLLQATYPPPTPDRAPRPAGKDDTWGRIWAELREGLHRQPDCREHPNLRCVLTYSQGAVNDIISVTKDGIQVRSHRTSRVDSIPVSTFRVWWDHLLQHGSAPLDPNAPDCPRSDRAVLVGAIMARCLPNRIRHSDGRIVLLSFVESREFILPEELPINASCLEGASRTVVINAYERDPDARRRCIEAHGCRCCICTFDFGSTYGPTAEGYIHVHHLRSLSEVGKAHLVDPVTDLRPVCPNCHAVLHRQIPAFSIEEVRAFLYEQKKVKV